MHRASPYEELARITSLSRRNGSLREKKDAWLGEMLKVSPQVSLMLV